MSKVSGKGKRYSSGKLEVSQVPTSIINAISKVFMYGAQKYEKNNWRRGMSWSVVYDCMQRHSMKWLDGEELDKESGLPHLYHIAANVAMLIEYSGTCPELDDRYKEAINDYESFDSISFNTYDNKNIDK